MSLPCRDSVHRDRRGPAFREPIVCRRIVAFSAVIEGLLVVALSLMPAPSGAAVAQGATTLEVDHEQFCRAGERLALGSLAGLDELDSGRLEEGYFTYNMVRSELAVEWLLDGAVVDRSSLERGLGKRASHTFSRKLPATLEVRFAGPSGQVQVTSIGVSVAGRKEVPATNGAPTAIQTSIQNTTRPSNLELGQTLDFETVARLRSVALEPGESDIADARARRLRYPAGNDDPWATAVPHLVEIAGVQLGEGARLVSTLTARLGVVARDEPSRGTPVLRPGKASYDQMVIAGPMPLSGDVVRWFDETVDGRAERRSGSVVVLNRAGEEEQRYAFFDCWPTRLSVDVTTGTWSLTLMMTEIDFQFR